MTLGVSESRFFMWRAVVAMVHADGVVTPHELSFVNEYINDINFSEGQMKIIGEDLSTPQDVYDMFARITDVSDKKDFFALARALAWCDGDFAKQEQHILKVLENTDFDDSARSLLNETRDMMNEIELDNDQWHFKTKSTQSLFGFLTGRKMVTAS